MRIAIGSDHRGFVAKERLKEMLSGKGHEVQDYGTNAPNGCDYPDLAYPTCKAVTGGKAEMAILICGSGIGMCISANKVHGIRAALCHDELTAEMSRRHNNANVLCLGERWMGVDLAESVTRVFLDGSFEGGRHQRRIDLIDSL